MSCVSNNIILWHKMSLPFLFVICVLTSQFGEINAQDENNEYYNVGQNITFSCKTISDLVWWTFNEKKINNTDRYVLISVPENKVDDNLINDPAEAIFYVHILYIYEIVPNDEGNYTCYGYEDNNIIPIKSHFLQPVLRPLIVNSSPKILRTKIKESVVLYCTIQLFPLNLFNIKWDTKLFFPKAFLANTAKIDNINKTHINATLEILDISKKENGTYCCSISSTVLDFFVKKEIIVIVLDVPHIVIDYAKAVGASRIYLNWTINDGNDPVKQYFIQYMKEGNPTFTYYNLAIDGKNTSYILENFLPNTSYQIRITARNSIGDGPSNTYYQWVRTLEEDPVFIPKVEVTGSTSSTVTIAWQPPPPHILDYIQYYELVVSEAGENPYVVEEAIHQQNNRNLPYMFDHLKTATEYQFKVRACSDLTEQCGPWSEIVNGITMDGIASKPTNINVTCSHFNISRRNIITITWDPPKQPNGKIIAYLIKVNGTAMYKSEGVLKHEIWGPLKKQLDDNKYKYIVEEVKSNTNYTASVSAITRSKKYGDDAVGYCTMPVTVPDVIGSIMWSKIKTGDEKCIFKLLLPKISERNGPICCYRIFLVRLNRNSKESQLPQNLDILSYHEVHSTNNSKVGAYLAEMFLGDDYRSEIFLGDGVRIQPKIDQEVADSICKNCLKNIQSKGRWHFPATIEKYEDTSRENFLMKAQNATQEEMTILYNKTKRNPKFLFQHKFEDVTPVANSVSNNEFPNVYDGEIDMSSNYTGFLEVVVQDDGKNIENTLISYSAYFETISPQTPEYDNFDEMSLILNITVHLLCALILLVIILLAALCIMHRYYSRNSIQGDEVISLRDSLSRAFCGGRTSNHRHFIGPALSKSSDIAPISRADLLQAYLNRHRDTDYGFLREFEMLPSRFSDRTTKNSEAKENCHKNRYPDIKAYDQTRVKLSPLDSIQGSDYINANFVIGYKERKKFICAQGPMDSTVIDFWRMVWEQHLEIIVMLTNLEEYNKAKCAKYWPEKISDSKQYGDITVIFLSEQRYSDYLVRCLNILKKTGVSNYEEERRQIMQYHYLAWKDFMAPEHPYGIIKFIRQINTVYSVQRGPLLVHCSAGVGRTGTLVALDSLTQQLEEEDQVSIFNTVWDLRHQRNFLVQSLKQYIFLYRALLDIAQFGNTEILAKDLNTTVEHLKMKSNDSKEKCKLEIEFEKIKYIAKETNKSCFVGSGDEYKNKNRSESVIPFDRNRVILMPIPAREFSTYINASLIEGYDNSELFIITQDPMENTVGDFWRMISEQCVTTIIMLSEVGDGPRKCPRYWADDEIQYDHILIKYIHSESCPYYTRREFSVTNHSTNETIKVTQFQYNGWPTVEGEVPEVCRGIIELVDQTQKHHEANPHSTLSPIVVHCSLGTDRSSIFVAMCSLVQQLRIERKVDICTTARKLRTQRPMLLNEYAQYEFLHRAIVNYSDLHNLCLDFSPSSQ